ncbi:hypothetical protein BDN70DRAFT_937586 [Pholiota conissans]|uniref:Fungal-type protein kinase domain-containing protein n=1 Tax=Pholiota conissans TaxID=109636 RepID=A0A9P5YQG6_9AGAR|nr:hypothetical protein BDN70DRAFT_937586 [Pholiota conissans]
MSPLLDLSETRHVRLTNAFVERLYEPTTTTKSSTNSITGSVRSTICYIQEQYATSVLLVDFDRGENLDKKRKNRRAERTGTLMFMARAIRMEGPQGEISDIITYPGVPELMPVARAAFERAFPDRLERFPSSPHTSVVGTDQSLWSHRLYHDAESAYWLLAWWAVTASPLGHPKLLVDDAVWSGFNQPGIKEHARNYKLLPDALDPLYSPLGPLLRSLGFFLRHDLFWASQEPHTHPEFLHEVFQRSILNFIVENQNEAFMNHPKASSLRYRAEWCVHAVKFGQ